MVEERWLGQLRDRLDIEDLLTRYCAAIDAKDFDLLDEVFTADATIDYTRSGGIRDAYPAVKSWLTTVLAPFRVVQHLITNVRVEIDGDRARSVCYFFNPMGLPQKDEGVHTFFCGGIYRDQLIRTERGWRITERVNDQLYAHGALPAGLEQPK
jgi:3-phenylpropionate/cinnamic acid dioxygenase small subunit